MGAVNRLTLAVAVAAKELCRIPPSAKSEAEFDPETVA